MRWFDSSKNLLSSWYAFFYLIFSTLLWLSIRVTISTTKKITSEEQPNQGLVPPKSYRFKHFSPFHALLECLILLKPNYQFSYWNNQAVARKNYRPTISSIDLATQNDCRSRERWLSKISTIHDFLGHPVSAGFTYRLYRLQSRGLGASEAQKWWKRAKTI